MRFLDARMRDYRRRLDNGKRAGIREINGMQWEVEVQGS